MAERLQDVTRYQSKTSELVRRQRDCVDNADVAQQRHLEEARQWQARVDALDKLLAKRRDLQQLHDKRLARKQP